MTDIDQQQIEQLAKSLGDDAASRLDVDATAQAVVRRLEVEKRRSPRRQRWWAVRVVAAAAVIVLAVGIFSKIRNGPEVEPIWAGDAPEIIHALSDDELVEVFDSLYLEAPVSEIAAVGLDDMNMGQLEELLQTMMED